MLPSHDVQGKKAARRKLIEEVERKLFALNQITPYPLTYPILERYADICRILRPLHQDIGDIDTLIAATALEEDLILLTIDHDYERVPDLKYELVNLKNAA